MGMTGMEAALQAVEDTLSANMAAKITALNDEYGDGIELSDIITYSWDKRNFAAQEYPACVLDDIKSIPEEQYMMGMSMRHLIDVYVVAVGSDAKELKQRLFRYVRAIWEILTSNHTLGGVSHSVGFGETEYGPTFTEKERKYLKSIAIEIEVYKKEEVA